MSIEAMKLALEALEYWQKTCLDCGRGSDELGRATKPIVALRQAIEQAEQVCISKNNERDGQNNLSITNETQEQAQPVAWITDGGKGELWWYQSEKFDDDGNLIGPNPDDIPLYTTQPQRHPLTDEEIMDIFICSGRDKKSFARAIEAAHGIKGEE